MSYQVKLYKNTGFNPENIPASPAVLDSVASAGTAPALEIMQQRYLSGVRVSISWDDIKDVDYCKIGDEYYFVGDGIRMVASDVAYLPLELDPITSVGGVGNIKVLDGQTERYSGVTVGSGDDPLLAPKNTMDIEGGWILGDTTGSEYIECTLSPGRTVKGEAITYVDDSTGEKAAVPKAKACGIRTQFIDVVGNVNLRETCLYDSKNENTREYIAGLRSLGLEGAIISHVRYPSGMVEIDTGGESISGEATSPVASRVTGKSVTAVQLPISDDIAAGCDNADHINNSDFAKVGLVSCDGSSVEFIPADVDISMGVTRITDPNPDGRPFFRFKKYKGDSSVGGFWKNAIAGMKWKNIPLKYMEASGTSISRLKTNNEMALNSLQSDADNARAFVHAIGQLVSFGASFATGGGMMSSASGASPLSPLKHRFSMTESMSDSSHASINSGNPLGTAADMVYNVFNKGLKNSKAFYDFALGTVQTPQLSFPYEAETLRDMNGNGVYCYRYKYSAADLARIDKLITRYGKKYVAALTEDMLVPGANENFVFIQCNGVSVTHKTQAGRSSNWLNQAIAGQLEGGIRIWNVAPTAGTV